MEAVRMKNGNINPELAAHIRPIGSATPYPNNPRRGDIDAIRASLRSNGQYKCILLQKSTGYIIVGNNTWQAAVEEGWSELAMQDVDVDDTRARAILLADNKIPEGAQYDEQALATLLGDMLDTQGLLGTGWDADEAEDLMARIQQIELAPYEEFTGDYADYGDGKATGYGDELEEGEVAMTSHGVPSLVGQLREVIVMVRTDAYDGFQENVRACMKKYALNSLTETVQEALRREAERD